MAYEQRDYGGRGGDGGGHDAPFIRGRNKRAVTDYSSIMVHWMRNRKPRFKGGYHGEMERPSASYIIDMLPPLARLNSPADTIPSRFLHLSLNKNKHPVNVVRWTPEGRRLLTGSSSGEFTLWNGTGFNFETIMQAHDVAIRALSYSHSDDWLLSADQDGLIKYWQPNFNNVKVIQGHGDAIRDLAFSPTDTKFVTASDDSTLKVFDFAGGVEESVLTGHGWDAKAVDWHPTKGLLVSGSKDHLVKLWDPRTSRCLTTLHGHKNTITAVKFEKVRGQCLASSARDQIARVFDLRMMRDILLLKGHEKDISTLTWHPIHSSLLSTGSADGSMCHYLLDEPNYPPNVPPTIAPYDSPDPETNPAQTIYPAHAIKHAHEFPIWSLDWHPLGHILASGSNDRLTKFWTRARPGDKDIPFDRHHIGDAAAEANGTFDRRNGRRQRQEEEEQEMEDETEGLVDQKMPAKLPGFPGIPGLPLPQFGAQAAPKVPGLPGLGAVPPPPIPGVSGNGMPPPIPGMDPSNPPDPAVLQEMMRKAGIQMPILPSGGPPMPPPGMGMIPPPFAAGFPPPPPGVGAPPFGIPGMGRDETPQQQTNANGSVRRRGPLPSQEESLRMEQKQGKYTKAR